MLGENRICRRSRVTTEAHLPTPTMAESLRDLGVVLRQRTRHGAETDFVPCRRMGHEARTDLAFLLLRPLRWKSKLALEFITLRESVQLRAMVEDWPLHRIQEVIRTSRLEARCAQERCLTRIGPQRITDPVNKCAWLRWAAFVIWLTAFVFAADLVMEFIKGLCY